MLVPNGLCRGSKHLRNFRRTHQTSSTAFQDCGQGGVGVGIVLSKILDPAADDANRISHRIIRAPVSHHLVLDRVLLIVKVQSDKVCCINVRSGGGEPVCPEPDFPSEKVDVAEPEGGGSLVMATLAIFPRVQEKEESHEA